MTKQFHFMCEMFPFRLGMKKLTYLLKRRSTKQRNLTITIMQITSIMIKFQSSKKENDDLKSKLEALTKDFKAL